MVKKKILKHKRRGSKINKTRKRSSKRNKTKRKSNKTKIKRRINLYPEKARLPPGKTALTLATLGALSATPLGASAAVAAATVGGLSGIMGAGIYNNKTKNNLKTQSHLELEEVSPLLTLETSRRQTQALPKQTSPTQTLSTQTMQEIADIENIISEGGEKLITSISEIINDYINKTIDFAELQHFISNLNWSIFTSVGGLTANYFKEHIITFFDKIRVHERSQVVRELFTRLINLGRRGGRQRSRERAAGPIKLDGGGNKNKNKKTKRR